MIQSLGEDAKALFMMVGGALFALVFMGCLSCAHAHEKPQTGIHPIFELPGVKSKCSRSLRLAELVERQDSVIMRTDPKDKTYQERQWEEREKERQSWDMLKNMIIDGRQPPRRFSDPRANERPQ